jgi:hypothetical protein
LDAHVRGVAGPVSPPPRDPVQGCLIPETAAVCGDFGDGDRHRGVVSPFPGSPIETAAADHRDRAAAAQRRAEFVACAEGVPAGRPQ